MQRQFMGLILGALTSNAVMANDRAIVVSPVHVSSWEFPTHTNQGRARPHLGVGFWQRASGAKPGEGSNYVSVMEYQLPEAAPARVRSATFQFSGQPSQCSGAEPVVIDVYAYAGDGKGDVGDTRLGSRIGQMSAGCTDNPAFARPIDVTQIVRQMSVPAGIRFVGFNIRKGNNRQGPGLFGLAPGKLTVVLADQPIAQRPLPAPTQTVGGGGATPVSAKAAAAAGPATTAALPARSAVPKSPQEQAKAAAIGRRVNNERQ